MTTNEEANKVIEDAVGDILKRRVVEDNEIGSLIRESLGISSLEAARERYPTAPETH